MLEATVEVLEHAGYTVSLPSRPLCRGRPLYDAGMLTTAGRLWRQVLDILRDDIRAGVPVVGVEPNCVAALGTDAEEALLRRMGVDAEVMDAGCCGLAGSFGFSASKYDVSVRVGERKMAPRIRAASADTQIVTDGFSCREQIQHLTDRQPRHLAELFRDAIRAQQAGSPD